MTAHIAPPAMSAICTPLTAGAPFAGTGHPEHPRPREVVHVVPRAVREGAVLPVARDGAHDEPGVLGEERVVAAAEAREHARAKALEQHVVVAHEAAEQGRALGSLEVEHHVALVAVEGEVRRAHVTRHGRHVTEVVPLTGVFDLVDARAEVGEHERGEGAGEQSGEVEDAHARQGSMRGVAEGRDHRAEGTARRDQSMSLKSFWRFIASIWLPLTFSLPAKKSFMPAPGSATRV
jgi:hypothetical protein